MQVLDFVLLREIDESNAKAALGKSFLKQHQILDVGFEQCHKHLVLDTDFAEKPCLTSASRLLD